MGDSSTYRGQEDIVSASLVLVSVFANNYSVNWYQRNYPYAWIGARLVKDL